MQRSEFSIEKSKISLNFIPNAEFSPEPSSRILVRKVTFHEIQPKFFLKNKNFLMKCSQDSEIMKFIILKKKSFLEKLFFFFKKFMISHIISSLLSVFFIIIQNFYGKYCYMSNCLCDDDLLIKTFVAFKEFFTYWIIFIIYIIQSIFVKKLFGEKTNFFKGFYLIICSIFTISLVIFSKESNYFYLLHYIFYFFLCVFLELWGLVHLKEKFKEKIMIFIRINTFPIVIFGNYLFYLLIYRKINEFILLNFEQKQGKNLISLYVTFYTLIITYFLKKIVLNYSEFLLNLSQRNTSAIINLMRISLCIFVSITISNLLKMDINDWGGWFLLISYTNLLINFYFRIDFMWIFFTKLKEKIKNMCFLNKLNVKKTETDEKNEKKKNKNRSYIKKLLSGCVLDIQVVSCFRIAILFLSNRWSGSFFEGNFYLNCKFEVNNEKFHMNFWGLIAVIGINTIMAMFLYWYMIKTKNLIMLYKMKHNLFYNLYFLFLIHVFLEAMINMFYFYIPSVN